ncbi:hypothetical protein LXL04_007231 [Taraxacum kok-saghyz]
MMQTTKLLDAPEPSVETDDRDDTPNRRRTILQIYHHFNVSPTWKFSETSNAGEEEKQQMNKAQPPLDFNDFTIIIEGEAEIFMHAKNDFFYNKTQVNNRDLPIVVTGIIQIQTRRPELHLIIASATIEAKSMAEVFHNRKKRSQLEGEYNKLQIEPAILSVEGRGYNVKMFYVEEPVSDYLQATVSTVMSIHHKEPMGDILVFLTSQYDIDTAVQMITEEAQNSTKSSFGMIVLPLYSGLTRADQDLIFSPSPRGKRKVVISTNIAETSLTLEGIVYVVDTGFSRQRFYNPLHQFPRHPLDKGQVGQENVTENEISSHGISEMQRSNLVSTVIQVYIL